MSTGTNSAYSNIIKAINENTDLDKDLFSSFIEVVNGQSIFELTETELFILEFIKNRGRKYSLSLVLSKENPKTGELIEKLSPKEKLSPDLIAYKHTPYQYVVCIN
ncbi:hypothetical protein AMD27_17050 (plasmid) [Acinetobacter sp. TGL-Y2]|uniref:hypothetical protein n=1 Tax=Acinetobacter sp. TGL-Y2 TaxID=1407071 RepID=UPI0007A667DD|nr:hypothetical protein [Acinetobacter sp. TGL-Y2]AMW80625.1 hypothetical protein AMD27_17050 [Acinetobacter sp. TGL-Y2]